MKKMSVLGVGILSALGSSPEEVWRALSQGKSCSAPDKIPFSSFLPPAKKRRTDRFSDMTVFVGVSAVRDSGREIDEKTGTIFTTGYGPLTGNIAFAEKVSLGDPDVCSPTAFSGTVFNACVGHLCMHLGCKGSSTVLTGSNAIGYAQMLLSSQKAGHILCGAVEEYNAPLFTTLRSRFPLSVPYAEGAVCLFLSSEEAKDRYCDVLSCADCFLGGYPPFADVDEEVAKKRIEEVLTSDPAFATADAVLPSWNGSYFDTTEKRALSVLGDIPVLGSLKALTGETLGCSLTLSVAVGAICLAHGSVPSSLGKETPLSSLLVTGYDVSGNYSAILLKK